MWPFNILRRSIRARFVTVIAVGLLPLIAALIALVLSVNAATVALRVPVEEIRSEFIPITEQYRAVLRAQQELHARNLYDYRDPDKFRQFASDVDATFVRLRAIEFDMTEEAELVDTAHEQWQELRAMGEEVFKMAPDIADEELTTMVATFDERSAELFDTIRLIQEAMLDEISAQPAGLEVTANRIVTVLLGVLVVALFLGVGAFIWVLRTIIGPLTALREVADRLGAGDLSQRVSLPYRDEIGRLGDSFNATADRLETNLIEREELAVRDELTGLFNRREFARRLNDEEIQRAYRYGRPLSLLILDLDNLKAINDEHGHLAGDQALRDVARSVDGQVRPVDFVARYGGDEFVVMATEADAEEAVTIAERIRRSVAGSTIRLDSGEYVNMSVSIGIATFPEDAGTAGDLMLAADTALYRAKAAGRDQVRQAASTPGSAATSSPTPTDPPAS